MDPGIGLTRHFSDTFAFAPRHPSRLGPGRKNRPAELTMGNGGTARGTVSMPTSPLMGSSKEVETSVWGDSPQSAQAFLTFTEQKSFELNHGQWYDDREPHHPPSHETHPSLPDHATHPTFPEHVADPVHSISQSHHPTPSSDGPYAASPSSADLTSMDEMDGMDGGMTLHQKKKRAQVRIACTHCQKACKKCSNTRPCERCVKYGLKDCVDSTRKPRKTGIKRGPYKRRSTSKYHPDTFLPTASSSHVSHHLHPPLIDHGHRGGSPPFLRDPRHHPSHLNHTAHTRHSNHPNHPNHHPMNDPHRAHPYHGGHPNPSHPYYAFSPNPNEGDKNHPTYHFPPAPRPAALHGAVASAMSGPRWVHGQRTLGPGGGTAQDANSVLYPPTPTVPFPISLNHRDTDPFSRAVSPIHGDLDHALQGLKPRFSFADQVMDQSMNQEMGEGVGEGMGDEMDQGQGWDIRQHLGGMGMSMSDTSTTFPFTDPFADIPPSAKISPNANSNANTNPNPNPNPNVVGPYSAPTSPRQTHWTELDAAFRSSSVGPEDSATRQPHALAHSHSNSHPHPLSLSTTQGYLGQTPSLHSPAMVALKKIRKPSLRTLMSHGGSQAGSRQVSPVPESPTLFDQPMEMDDDAVGGMGVGVGVGEEDVKMDSIELPPAAPSWMGESDAIGQQTGNQDHQGLGLMGIDSMPFTT